MDFKDTPDEAAFRAEVRAWLAENAKEYREPPPHPWPEVELVSRSREWLHRKAKAGFATITWPKEIGGRGGTAIQEVIFRQEEAKYTVPHGAFITIGVGMTCPTIRKHGTAEQYQRFAPKTLTGEYIWCQLFSEPGAGSDLAGITTRAVRQGDNWVVNGQKVWNSWAHHAEWGILLARTDPSVPKHKGLTLFLVDMRTPGIEARPINQISGRTDFNQTFLENVVIPDSCRVGEVGEGWACALTVLMNERIGAVRDGLVVSLIARARDNPRGAGRVLDSADVRTRLARLYADEQGVKYFGFRLLTSLSRGEPPPPSVSLIKLVQANHMQQANGYAMDLDDFGGLFEGPDRPHQDLTFFEYTFAAGLRIAGGADEVLRNQLAERVLGMPQEERVDKNVPFDKIPR
jgi:alkylation response protein AidB-like acyl-CoA dehydrogenase